MKRCPKCGNEKPVTDYYRNRCQPDGVQPYCKVCWQEQVQVYIADGSHSIWNGIAKRLSRFRMTKDEYQTLLASQGGTCAICHQVDACALSVDHDHGCCPAPPTCGRCTRGLLCRACNRHLASEVMTPARLRAGAEYLEKWSGIRSGGY